ncbi:MAG: hypothetical protein ACLQT7_08625 [Candidatus Dormibacteria bacterium]
MLTLTPFERSLRALLVEHLRDAGGDQDKALITEEDLDARIASRPRHGSDALRPPHDRFFQALSHICIYEDEHGRPLLGAIVVVESTRRPGDWFQRLTGHLGFETTGTRLWSDELDALIDLWSWQLAPDTLVIADIIDRGVETLDAHVRALERSVRRGSRLPYLSRSASWPCQRNHDFIPMLRAKNVGDAPAVDALYWGMSNFAPAHRSDPFSLAAGEGPVDIPLRHSPTTLMREVMGDMVDDVAEVLVYGDGAGRWLRQRPHLAQRADVWVDDGRADPPAWLAWYRTMLREIGLRRS